MKITQLLEAALGAYLILPGPEDFATGGTTALPSAILGAALVAHAFGMKLPRLF